MTIKYAKTFIPKNQIILIFVKAFAAFAANHFLCFANKISVKQ